MAKKLPKETKFKTYWYHRKMPYWLDKDPGRPEGVRDVPELVRLEVEDGVEPNSKPPVRIFLGTENAQYRAERIFVWSVLQHRDPARVYEIHLMKDVKGFDRTGWKTGFTNYRYAIPTWAGGQGRAIYNDVDQIYLADPGEMFDLDMQGAGMLGITQRETSVMLIDCEKMIDYWKIEDAQSGHKHKHFRALVLDNKLWGQLPPVWNARDDEFKADESKCFHFTTLQTQPWQPMPEQLNYRPHPDGKVWFDLEESADRAGFTVFTKERPSQRYRDLLEQHRVMHEKGERRGEDRPGRPAAETFDGRSLKKEIEPIAALIRETGAKEILDYGAGKGVHYQAYEGEPETSRYRSQPAWPGVKVVCFDPCYAPFAEPFDGQCDGVISTDVVEHLPPEDVPWVLDEMFKAAKKFVYVATVSFPAKKSLNNGDNAHSTIAPPAWWRGQMERAAKRHPNIRWVLTCDEKTRLGKKAREFSGIEAMDRAA